MDPKLNHSRLFTGRPSKERRHQLRHCQRHSPRRSSNGCLGFSLTMSRLRGLLVASLPSMENWCLRNSNDVEFSAATHRLLSIENESTKMLGSHFQMKVRCRIIWGAGEKLLTVADLLSTHGSIPARISRNGSAFSSMDTAVVPGPDRTKSNVGLREKLS